MKYLIGLVIFISLFATANADDKDIYRRALPSTKIVIPVDDGEIEIFGTFYVNGRRGLYTSDIKDDTVVGFLLIRAIDIPTNIKKEDIIIAMTRGKDRFRMKIESVSSPLDEILASGPVLNPDEKVKIQFYYKNKGYELGQVSVETPRNR